MNNVSTHESWPRFDSSLSPNGLVYSWSCATRCRVSTERELQQKIAEPSGWRQRRGRCPACSWRSLARRASAGAFGDNYRMGKLIAATFILLATAAAILLTAGVRGSPPPAPKVTVTFLDYSNSAASGLLACFAVTNASPGPVIRCFNYRLLAPATTLGRWAMLSVGNFTNQGNLKAGDSEVILLPVPTNAPAWRLSLTVSRDEPFRMLAAPLVVATRRLLGRPPMTGSSGYYPVASEPINQ